MIEATVYLLEDDGIKSKTTTFPFRTETTLRKHLTSIYGSDTMERVQWDIIEPEEEEGLEEIETTQDDEITGYLRKRLKKGKR
jgi:hypothetical protein